MIVIHKATFYITYQQVARLEIANKIVKEHHDKKFTKNT